MSRNMEIMEMVAARKITPEEGARLMLEHDERVAEEERPRWVPRPVWRFLTGSLHRALTTS